MHSHERLLVFCFVFASTAEALWCEIELIRWVGGCIDDISGSTLNMKLLVEYGGRFMPVLFSTWTVSRKSIKLLLKLH